MSNYQHVISDFTFEMGAKGVYDVWVDDNLIYSKHQTGRHAHDGEVFALFQEMVGSDVAIYGT